MRWYFVFLGLIINACTQPEKKTDVNALTQRVVGIYEASFPCDDCISIEYQLELASDASFVEHITYLGKLDGTYEVHGNWQATADSLLTLTTGKLIHQLKVTENGTLIITDALENHLEQKTAVVTPVGTASRSDAALLNGIWWLEAIDLVEVTADTFPRETPRLEFHQAEGKVIGTSGCNPIHGTYITASHNISISPVRTTKMACTGQGESLFIQSLQEVTTFKVVGNKLYLLVGSTEKLRLGKAD